MSKDNKQIAVNNVSLSNPTGLLELAGTVKQFIVEQKLYTAIQGRNYVNVEGWQFAGGMIGVLPVVLYTENLSSDKEIKYRASVDLINIANGNKVGSGIATCSNLESGKQRFAEYAIESMAQTRAVGKAYRLMLGWLMKAAGYEATPAEEMDFDKAEVMESNPAPAAKEEAPAGTIHDKLNLPADTSLRPNSATEKQMHFIKKLLNSHKVPADLKERITGKLLSFNVKDANTTIDYLKGLVEAPEMSVEPDTEDLENAPITKEMIAELQQLATKAGFQTGVLAVQLKKINGIKTMSEALDLKATYTSQTAA
jgi:hypothetical protein